MQKKQKSRPAPGGQSVGDRAKRCLVLANGDLPDLPGEVQRLLQSCGCAMFRHSEWQTREDLKVAKPDFLIVNLAAFRKAKKVQMRIKALRARYEKPVVCLMPQPSELETAQAAEIDADVTVYKPLCAGDFMSRVRILLWQQRSEGSWPLVDRRRRVRRKEDRMSVSSIEVPHHLPFRIISRDRMVILKNKQVRLAQKEHALLVLFATDPGRIFTFEEILARLWAGSTRASKADVHQIVYSLRKKVESDPRNPKLVLTVPSVGYKLGVMVESGVRAS